MSTLLTFDAPVTAPDPASVEVGRRPLVDMTLAAVALILVLPVLLLLIVAIKLTSTGPAIYRSERLGLGGRRFSCLKLRTMAVDADDLLERMLALDPEIAAEFHERRKLDEDPRITRLGRFLRVTSLDELPQLVHVVRGEMRLVGPRPKLPVEQENYGPHLAEVLTVRPGLTGLWQVSGRNRLTFEERISLDLSYVRSRTAALDVWIVLRTIAVLLFPRSHGAQ